MIIWNLLPFHITYEITSSAIYAHIYLILKTKLHWMDSPISGLNQKYSWNIPCQLAEKRYPNKCISVWLPKILMNIKNIVSASESKESVIIPLAVAHCLCSPGIVVLILPIGRQPCIVVGNSHLHHIYYSRDLIKDKLFISLELYNYDMYQ